MIPALLFYVFLKILLSSAQSTAVGWTSVRHNAFCFDVDKAARLTRLLISYRTGSHPQPRTSVIDEFQIRNCSAGCL